MVCFQPSERLVLQNLSPAEHLIGLVGRLLHCKTQTGFLLGEHQDSVLGCRACPTVEHFQGVAEGHQFASQKLAAVMPKRYDIVQVALSPKVMLSPPTRLLAVP